MTLNINVIKNGTNDQNVERDADTLGSYTREKNFPAQHSEASDVRPIETMGHAQISFIWMTCTQFGSVLG